MILSPETSELALGNDLHIFHCVVSYQKSGLTLIAKRLWKTCICLVFGKQFSTLNRLKSCELRAHVLFTRTHMVTCVKWEHSFCHKYRAFPSIVQRPAQDIWDVSLPPMTTCCGRGKGGPYEWQVALEWENVCLVTKLLSGSPTFLYLLSFFLSFSLFSPSTSIWGYLYPPAPVLTLDTHPTHPPASTTWNWPMVLSFLHTNKPQFHNSKKEKNALVSKSNAVFEIS